MKITPNTPLTEETKQDIINTYLQYLSEHIKYSYKKDVNTLILDIDFKGWYNREKIIDRLYCRLNYKRYRIFDILCNLDEINIVFNEKYGYKRIKICDIHINWHNLEKDEEVPEIMKNLLSHVSYKEYLTY